MKSNNMYAKLIVIERCRVDGQSRCVCFFWGDISNWREEIEVLLRLDIFICRRLINIIKKLCIDEKLE